MGIVCGMKGTPIGSGLRRRSALAATAAAALAMAGAAGQADAKTFEVSNYRADGKGSLSKAIENANRDRDKDRIVFSRQLRGRIAFHPASIKNPVVLQGRDFATRGSHFGRLKLVGGSSGTPLKVTLRQKGERVSIRDLYLKRVWVKADAQAARSRIQVRDSYLIGDGSADRSGVFAFGTSTGADGLVRVDRSTITGFRGGGVLASSADVRVDRSTISNNDYSGVQASFHGDAEVTNSTITGNVVTQGNQLAGAGVSTYYEADATVINSTVVGNRVEGAGGFGGGIDGEVKVIESTVSGNSAEVAGGVVLFGEGELVNSIVGGNTATGGGPADCDIPPYGGPTYSGGGNVITEPGPCVTKPSDVIGADPGLFELDENGGPTETMALRPGSPAIDHAILKQATKFDQRGVKRGKHPDAGAFERK
jgi:hypothetical protein